jgi:hypothetical protein
MDKVPRSTTDHRPPTRVSCISAQIPHATFSHFTRISCGSHADLATRHFPRIHDAIFYTPADSSGAFEATHFESRNVAAMKPREIDTTPVWSIRLDPGFCQKNITKIKITHTHITAFPHIFRTKSGGKKNF